MADDEGPRGPGGAGGPGAGRPGGPGGPAGGGRQRSGAAKWGPLAVVGVVVVAVVAFALISGSGDDEASTDDTASGGAGNGPVELPDGVMSFSVAEEEGTVDDIDWGERCDVERGQYAFPSFFAAECFAPFEGDNGGETATGVTADTIKVVQYLTPETDPVIDYITGAISVDDTNAEIAETLQNWTQFYNDFYELYGRKVELEIYEGTGPSDDAVAARADAVQIAEENEPFAVLGGPLLNPAFAEELAAREVLCISCTPGQPDQFYEDNAPYVWGVGNNPEQGQVHTAQYVTRRLAGRPAEYAGDEAFQGEDRVFGLVYLETSQGSTELADAFEEKLADGDVELAARIAYASPVDLQSTAESVIAKLKEAGVTTVIFTGDPIAPQPLTLAATSQDYFPEWVTTGSALVDTTTFARTYDQEQWAHAFGVSTLSARVSPEASGTLFLYKWYFGEDPPASTGAPTLQPNLSLFYAVLQGVGPDLTPENWGATLFNADPTPRSISQPSLSYGDKGIWPATDYLGIDDATEIWWDPDATGPDEIQRDGTGMWRYVDGGTRYLPGEWPDTAPNVFVDEGAVTIYDEAPAAETFPTYPSPAD